MNKSEQEFFKFNREMINFIIAILTMFMVIFLYYFFSKTSESYLLILGILSLIIAIFSLMSNFLITNPTTLSISLVGFPHSGKTVFLTVLFNELMIKDTPGIIFSTYGSETVEKVTKDLNILKQGQWLPPTKPHGVFFYRAKALVDVGISKRKFKIEISDYAGEHIKEFNPADDNWLHKSDYFNYVIESDAILLSIDSEKIMKAYDRSDFASVSVMENFFIAALQILIEKKGVDINNKLRAPVALVFMKCDLVPDNLLNRLPESFPRLTKFCKKRCYNFKIFLVSSVGCLRKDGSPPEDFRPFGIVDSINWILHKI